MIRPSTLEALRRYWWVALLFTLLGLAVGALPEPDRAADGVISYRARHTMLVSAENGTFNGDPVTTNQIVLYATTGEVPRRVADELAFATPGTASASLTNVTLDAGTGALVIEATDAEAARAVLIADTFAATLADYMDELQQNRITERNNKLLERADRLKGDIADLQARIGRNPDDRSLQAELDALSREYSSVYEQQYGSANSESAVLVLNTLQKAEAFPVEAGGGLAAPRSRSSRGAFGLILGALLGLGVATSLNRLDRRIRTLEQAEAAFGGKASVVVPHTDDARKDSPAQLSRTDAVGDAHRTLRSVIAFARTAGPFSEQTEGGRITLVVSPGPHDGKTSTALGLALSMAEANRRTIIVNADFRRPTVSKRLLGERATPQVFKLAQLSQVPLRQLLRRTPFDNLLVLDLAGSDPSPGNIARTTARMLPSLAKVCDEVVVDTSPVGATAEVLELLPFADHVVVAVRVGHTHRAATERTMQLLRSISSAQTHLAVIGAAVDRSAYYEYEPRPAPRPGRRRGPGDGTPGDGLEATAVGWGDDAGNGGVRVTARVRDR